MPRIDQDRDRPRLEQGEGQGEELQARLDHQDRPHAPADPERLEPARERVALAVELSERPVRVPRPPCAVAAGGADHGQGVRPILRHRGQGRGDVDEIEGDQGRILSRADGVEQESVALTVAASEKPIPCWRSLSRSLERLTMEIW